ncbi:UNVERIFIED_CONTAM: hypothetical protein NCL1_10914 [Trichonephila clavipes]
MPLGLFSNPEEGMNEPIRGKPFATQEDIANIVSQQVTRFTQGAANAEAGGIQCLNIVGSV